MTGRGRPKVGQAGMRKGGASGKEAAIRPTGSVTETLRPTGTMKSVSPTDFATGLSLRNAKKLDIEAVTSTAPRERKSSGLIFSMPNPAAVARAICAEPAVAAPCTTPAQRPVNQMRHLRGRITEGSEQSGCHVKGAKGAVAAAGKER